MDLSKEQRLIIESVDKYVQVIAAAGSGKTFTMIRLAQKVYDSKRYKDTEILLITFSRKAVGELKDRLEKIIGKTEIQIYTFHAYCLKIINQYYIENEKISIIDPREKDNLLKIFFESQKSKIGGIPYEILMSKNSKSIQKLFPNLLEELDIYYKDYKKRNNKMDFDDLVQIYLNGLKKNEEWAKLASREIKMIIVDEFQDTDPIQLEWLQEMNPERLIVVGDDWQAIYGFRGASTEPFLNFPNYFKPCKRFFLTKNHRSSDKVIKVSAIPISKNKKNISKKIDGSRKLPGLVKILKIRNQDDWKKILPLIKEEETVVLCRTNFRIKYLSKLGISKSQLMTIHASKGLEFKNVFLDLSGGWNNDFQEYIEEERRILYVGLSRAKDSLYIIGQENKKLGLEFEFFNYFDNKIDIDKFLSKQFGNF